MIKKPDNDKKQLLDLLSEVLGTYHEYPKQNEIAFYCPECKHYKRKLQVNIETGNWHCWVCETDNNMRGRSVYTLFKRVGVRPNIFGKLNDILGHSNVLLRSDFKSGGELIKRLPIEFIPLAIPNKSPYSKHALRYLRGRGITKWDIMKHNIGYAEDGDHKGKIIIPSYDVNGSLNFWVGREFYNQSTYKLHEIPEGWSKDIIGFELFVNWNLPIVLVEGVFDAFAIRKNAIPLFGKTVLNTLRDKIMKHDVQDIYLALDSDALKSIHTIAKEFVNQGRNIFIVEMNDGEDPSKLGFSGVSERISTAKLMESATSVLEFRLRSMKNRTSLLCI